MGCCGCTLSTSTVTAAAFGLIESIIGMAWNILFIVIIKTNEDGTGGDDLAYSSEGEDSLTTIAQDLHLGNNSTPWDRLRNTLTSKDALEKEQYGIPVMLLDVKGLDRVCKIWERFEATSNWMQFFEIPLVTLISDLFEIIVTALILNCFWFITSLALSVGNSEKSKDMLKPWIVMTILIVITDIAATVRFIIRIVEEKDKWVDLQIDVAFLDNIYILCTVLFSRGGIIIWVTNIALAYFVYKRIKELECLRKKKQPFDSDFRIAPYPLHSPYEAFEADSASPPAHETFKPHIPPPDYEGPMVNGRPKRPISYPGDYDTVAMSSNSMGSSRSSTAKRPTSNIYDSRMETHRNSMTAENVINHAYENRGFDLQSEGWTGIPRPTFKPR